MFILSAKQIQHDKPGWSSVTDINNMKWLLVAE